MALFITTLLFSAATIELILILQNEPAYFRRGIPVLVRRFRVGNLLGFWNAGTWLIDMELEGEWYRDFIFIILGYRELAFRYKIMPHQIVGLKFRLPLRGVIRIDKKNHVSIVCFLPYSLLVFGIVSLASFNMLTNDYNLLLFELGFIVFVIFWHRIVFNRVSQRIQKFFEQVSMV